MTATVNCLIKAKTSKLTPELKKELLEENKDINVSYLSLLRESLNYTEDVLQTNSWGGVRIYSESSLSKLHEAIHRNIAFNITECNDEVFHQEDEKRFERQRIMNNEQDWHTYKFRAYDDDMVFYVSGTCSSKQNDLDYLQDWLAYDMGVTYIKLYDRKTGKYLEQLYY